MIRKMMLLAIAFVSTMAMAQQITKPSVKTSTSFAIFVDAKSYAKVGKAVDAYRQSVEADGLGTYLAVADWASPEPIRELIRQWQADKKQPLEGVVFVGDIPIPMIRDAQYLTSAFKMNQNHDWKESSVPSDRFYDDFGLKFRFIKQDADNKSYFYYSLTTDGNQTLRPDIYSGRIRPLNIPGVDRYKMLSDYLYKVVRIKQQEKNNVVDNLSMGRGHSYNSQDAGVWAGEQLALREQMPQLFKVGNTVKFFDFAMVYPAKPVYLNETLNLNLDILLFHHHGAPDTEYINGLPDVSNIGPSIANVKRFLRSKVPSYAKKVGRDSAIIAYARQYDVPESWCAEAFDTALIRKDSIFSANMDIYTSDIRKINPNARFILFDACFNGSFHLDDNITGSYIFNGGNTVVTIGGTVNALQDKWPDEFVGLLSAGARVGQFNRFNGYLESHVIGDPTFRFVNNSVFKDDINKALSLHYKDAKYWRAQLTSSMPDVQGMALRQLYLAGVKDIVNVLTDTYFKSDNFVVRMEAVRLLSLYYPDQSVKVLKAALNDSYELVRRLSIDWAERNGSPELIPAIVKGFLQRGHEPRYDFRILNNLNNFDSDAVKAELDKQLKVQGVYDDALTYDLRHQLDLDRRNRKENRVAMFDMTLKPAKRRNAVFSFRNKPDASFIPDLLKVAANNEETLEIRLAAIHTLGWFDTNYRRGDIATGLKAMNVDKDELKDEITRTLKRLK